MVLLIKMAKLNKKQLKELNEVITNLKALIAEANGEKDSGCVAFMLSEDNKLSCQNNVRIYVDTWILNPLIRLKNSAN